MSPDQKKRVFERIVRFFEEKEVERTNLMIEKGFIDSSVPYSQKLWDEFREYEFKQYFEKNK